MALVELGSIMHFEKGKKPISQSDSPADGFLPYVDIEAFETGKIKQYTDGTKCTPCDDGDILIVCDGSRSGLVGRAVKGYVGSTLAKISADCLSDQYLFRFVQGKYALLNTKKKGTGTPHLNQELLKQQKLIVPSYSEQERIVARIEELFSQLDAGVETLKKTKAQLAVYRQAVLKEAFENISTFVPLSDVCQRVFDGPFGSNLKTSDYVSCGVRVVRLENLKNMWFDDSKQSFIANEKYELIASHTVFPTDLIMSTFISDSIKVCRLPNYIEYAVNKADCVGIRLSDNVNPDFVMFWLSSKEAYNRLSHQIHGATRPRVNTKQIKALQIPSVKKEVQDKIVSVIQEKFSVCDNIEQTINIALQQAEAMRQSILKDAFEGRL